MPTSQLQTSQHFEWDTPWSIGFLSAATVLVLIWITWQLVRESRAAKSRLWILFLVMRAVVATVLLWMILGPTAVLTRIETHPRTLAVYIDSSSSMQIQDQAEPLSDRRWELAGDDKLHPVVAADRVVLFASALRRQTKRLADSINEHATTDERLELITKWQQLANKCGEWLESKELKEAISFELEPAYHELLLAHQQEILAAMGDTGWLTGADRGDREQRLVRLSDDQDQFATRSRLFAEALVRARSDSDAANSATVIPTRLQRVTPAVRHGLTEWLKLSKDRFRVQLAHFSTQVVPLSLDRWQTALNGLAAPSPDGGEIRETNLSELLKQIRDDAGKEDIAAAVIVTDGRHTAQSPDDPRDLTTQLRMPLFLVPIGHGEMKRDLILHHLHAPTSVIQTDKILIEGIVTAHHCAGESCDVHLIEAKKVIDTRRVQFRAQQDDQRFSFEIPTHKVERREFNLVVERLEGEHSFANNSRSVAVDVTDAVLRILLADGQARWEYQYLVNLFNRQDKVELDQLHFIPQVVATGRRKKSRQFPQTVQEWSDYRVVILGDVSARQLNQQSQEALRDFIVQRGGSLIIVAGQNDMPAGFTGEPLEQILPVESDPSFMPERLGYRVEMTAEGKSMDAMRLVDDLSSTEQVWRESSRSLPIYFLSSFHKAKPSSQVLLNAVSNRAAATTAESPALLCWQTVGAGRVAYMSAPTSYQLRNRNGDQLHHRFWGQLIRWIVSRSAMTGSKTVKLLADKSNYYHGDVSQLSVELKDLDGQPVANATPQLDVIQAGNVITNVELTADPKVPGRYFGTFAGQETDKYTLRARGADIQRLLAAERYVDPVQIQIEFEPGLDRELSDPRADRPLLQHLAEQTAGLVLEPTVLAEVVHAVSLDPRIQTSSQKTPLWDRWWCLWALVGCLSLEWLIRKRIGLA